MRSSVAALCVALLALAGPGVLVQAGQASARGRQAAAREAAVTHVATLEERLLAAINDLRQRHGLGRLRLNPQLVATALQHSLSMAEHGYFQHTSLGGAPFWSRVESKYGGPSWRVGENLVWASPRLTAGQAIEMWLKSPPHRRNLLAPVWREIGIGAVHSNSAPGVYRGLPATILTADFGVRR